HRLFQGLDGRPPVSRAVLGNAERVPGGPVSRGAPILERPGVAFDDLLRQSDGPAGIAELGIPAGCHEPSHRFLILWTLRVEALPKDSNAAVSLLSLRPAAGVPEQVPDGPLGAKLFRPVAGDRGESPYQSFVARQGLATPILHALKPIGMSVPLAELDVNLSEEFLVGGHLGEVLHEVLSKLQGPPTGLRCPRQLTELGPLLAQLVQSDHQRRRIARNPRVRRHKFFPEVASSLVGARRFRGLLAERLDQPETRMPGG